MQTETWKPIAGFEDAYEVSCLGRVRSIPRTALMGRGIGAFRPVGGSVLKPSKTRTGYLKVSLRRGASRRVVTNIHRLVCEAFHGKRPSESHQVNHKNGRKSDNRVSNLEWVTPRENSLHSIAVLGNSVAGERNPNAKLTASQVSEIVAQRRSGLTCAAIAARFGVTVTTVSHICMGVSWKSVSVPVFGEFTGDAERSNRRGRFNGRAKLTFNDVLEMRKQRANGESVKDIAARFGVSNSTASSACKGKTWVHADN